MKPATPPCAACGRDPATQNTGTRECAVPECPHRPRCWSDSYPTYGDGKTPSRIPLNSDTEV
jgi:hypothetical protein